MKYFPRVRTLVIAMDIRIMIKPRACEKFPFVCQASVSCLPLSKRVSEHPVDVLADHVALDIDGIKKLVAIGGVISDIGMLKRVGNNGNGKRGFIDRVDGEADAIDGD